MRGTLPPTAGSVNLGLPQGAAMLATAHPHPGPLPPRRERVLMEAGAASPTG